MTLHANCHHPPYVLTPAEGAEGAEVRLSRSQVATVTEALQHSDPRKALAVLDLPVTLEVVECSWCRRPFEPVVENVAVPCPVALDEDLDTAIVRATDMVSFGRHCDHHIALCIPVSGEHVVGWCSARMDGDTITVLDSSRVETTGDEQLTRDLVREAITNALGTFTDPHQPTTLHFDPWCTPIVYDVARGFSNVVPVEFPMTRARLEDGTVSSVTMREARDVLGFGLAAAPDVILPRAEELAEMPSTPETRG